MHGIILSAALSAVAVSTPIIVRAEQPVEKQDTFTPEERKQALEALQTIANTFGQKQNPPQVQQQQNPPQKSMADVADKALDISTKYIGQAAAIIEKAAPRVWSVMVRQQYAKAIGDLIGPIVILICIVILTALSRKFWPRPREGSDEAGFWVFINMIIPLVAGIIFCGFFAYRLSDSVMYLINPEYYAIKDLVQILLKPGSL